MARKNAYVRAAKPRPLAEWLTKVADKAAGYAPEESQHPWLLKQRPGGDWVVQRYINGKIERFGPYPTEADARDVYQELEETCGNPNVGLSRQGPN